MPPQYRCLHHNWDPNQAFPFVVQRHRADQIYQDPIWGLEVLRVTADGAPVPGHEYHAALDDLNFNKTPIDQASFVYLVRRSALIFARKFDEKGGYELVKFDLPEKVKFLQIEYRLRESPTSAGPPALLESREP